MPDSSNIIDNRRRLMVNSVNDLLTVSDIAKFAVGYFYLSGFNQIAEKLSDVKEAYLLIGRQTDWPTVEELIEGHNRLNDRLAELEAAGKRKEVQKEMAAGVADSVRRQFEYMAQTDENEGLAESLADMIESGKLRVRIYTKAPLHSKAYIFTFKEDSEASLYLNIPGDAIIGSSNLTVPGLGGNDKYNTELNNYIRNPLGYEELTKWFKELWDEAEDFKAELLTEVAASWTRGGERRRIADPDPITPYDIYMKSCLELVKDRLEEKKTLWRNDVLEELLDFQVTAVRDAIRTIDDYRGVFISDVVGIGKSYTGSAIVKNFEIETAGGTALILCPKSLEKMWKKYKKKFGLKAEVVPTSMLQREGKDEWLLDEYGHCGLVLLDESHNFRNTGTYQYKALEYFLADGRPCCFLTATPINTSPYDVLHQIKLFHPEDMTKIDIDPPSLNEFFKRVENGEAYLPDLLRNLLIRRTRNQILRWYGYDEKTDRPLTDFVKSEADFEKYVEGTKRAYIKKKDGTKQFFPVRNLQTVTYSIEDTYTGFYGKLLSYTGRPKIEGIGILAATDGALRYVRYGLWDYVDEDKQDEPLYTDLKKTGVQLRGLMRCLLLKRLESSVEAFRCTVRRLRNKYVLFLGYLDEGIVLAGKEAEDLYKGLEFDEETEITESELLKARAACGKYIPEDFEIKSLRRDMEAEVKLFDEVLDVVDLVSPQQDAKLQQLKELLRTPLLAGKRIIFTESEDTARYLYENLKDEFPRVEKCTGETDNRIGVVNRFAPIANEYKLKSNEEAIDTVVATDVLAEGLNLQDCDKIINYDLHWNPVRLIQRMGRIDRIGSEQPRIYGFNFLPETNLDANLGLKEKVAQRIREIHAYVGEDAAILDPGESVNRNPMYALDEAAMLAILAGQKMPEEKEELQDLNDIEEMVKQFKTNHPEDFERIENLHGGIRTCRKSDAKGIYVFLQAGDSKELRILDEDGETVTRNKVACVRAIECEPDEEMIGLPKDYNQRVESARKQFAEEMEKKYSEQVYTSRLTEGQKYTLEGLREYLGEVTDDDSLNQIEMVSDLIQEYSPSQVKTELTKLKKGQVRGKDLFDRVVWICQRYRLQEMAKEKQDEGQQAKPSVRIVCGERLV